ncbi:MAG: quinone-dependent dihydroorotate dehydrogenase [Solirubrobacteraceae bacterium]|nr:quinone-dependent dihydroorotate dehydrogenase [Solirubrobacteraceae bacterium]
MRSGGLYPRVSRVLFRLTDAEQAHGLAVRALRSGLVVARPVRDERLRVAALGLDFPNPLGMAAGFDKNAEVPGPLLRLGFGFAEIGTVTPVAQSGNPQPRMFRLPVDSAVINRLGFNNAGHAAALAQLSAGRLPAGGIVGVNVGANKDAADRVADYVAGIETFAPVASYFTVNVSSPNTPGLRDLQAADALRELLTRTLAARDAAAAAPVGRHVPVLLKLAPDLDELGLAEAVEVAMETGVDGLVLSNTTLSRAGLHHPAAAESGGMSGVPLFAPSTAMLARVRQLAGPDVVLVGVGGIATGDHLFEKLRAGANLAQLYTGFVFGGPATARRVLLGLLARMEREGVGSVTELAGSGTDAWAARWPG